MGLKLAYGIPWDSPFMYTAAAESLADLQAPEGWQTRFIRGRGWCPAKRHMDLCETALAWGADAICILGADQVFPRDLLITLTNHMTQGREVITALVPTRGYLDFQPMQPFEKIAWRFKSGATGMFKGLQLTPELVETVTPYTGIQRVNFIGSGVLMFHRDHLQAVKTPWFRETYHPQTYQRLANMDCLFVWRLQQEAYAKVWCDTDINIRHASVMMIDDTYPERFADWTHPGRGDPAICNYGSALVV